MLREIHVVGDKSRLVVKNLIDELKQADFVVQFCEPDVERLKFLPSKRLHLVLCISDGMDFEVIKFLTHLHKSIGLYLYIVGTMNLAIKDEEFFKKIPAVRFSNLSIDISKLLGFMEKNDVAKKRILIVDDEPIMLRSIKTWLGEQFEVSLVNSGEMALQFLDMHPIDLVLLDYKMPTLTGPQVLQKIRTDKNMQDLPVIFLTANNDKESILSVVHLKPEGYILKTQSPEEIKQAVVDFFNNRIIVVD